LPGRLGANLLAFGTASAGQAVPIGVARNRGHSAFLVGDFDMLRAPGPKKQNVPCFKAEAFPFPHLIFAHEDGTA
jgi:hypothetical protein